MSRWQKAQNLVSRETLDAFWLRHVCDSARLALLNPQKHVWLDIGSGAGFPGLVTAIVQEEKGGDFKKGHVFLVESNMRKVSFLRAVIREVGLSASVLNTRIEEVAPADIPGLTRISARAVASLGELFGWAEPFMDQEISCYFHKGRNIAVETENVSNQWNFDLIEYEARLPKDYTSDGVIVEVRNLRRKA